MFPKVILIGGAPNTGKTTVSRIIASRLNYGCLSTDDLLKAITSVTTPASHPAFHFMAGWSTQEYYVHHAGDALMSHNAERLQVFRLAIDGVIKSHLAKDDPIVLEGFGLYPEALKGLTLPDVGMVWLVADEALLDKRTRAITPLYAGASDEERLIRHYVERSVLYNAQVIKAVERLGVPSVKVSDDMSAEALSVMLLNRLKLSD